MVHSILLACIVILVAIIVVTVIYCSPSKEVECQSQTVQEEKTEKNSVDDDPNILCFRTKEGIKCIPKEDIQQEDDLEEEFFEDGNFSCYNIQGTPTCVEDVNGQFTSLDACRDYCGRYNNYYTVYPYNYVNRFYYPMRRFYGRPGFRRPHRFSRRRDGRRGRR